MFDCLFPAIIHACKDQCGDSYLHIVTLQTLISGIGQIRSCFMSLPEGKATTDPYWNTKSQNFIQVVLHVLDIVWENWDHPVRSVSDKIRNLLERALEVHDSFVQLGLPALDLEQLAHSVLDGDWNRKSKYVALTSLLPRVGVMNILQHCPEVFTRILDIMDSSTSSSAAAHFYYNLALALVKYMLADADTQTREQNGGITTEKKVKKTKRDPSMSVMIDGNSEILVTWQEQCLRPIADVLISASTRQRDGIITYIIPHLSTIHPSNLSFLIDTLKHYMDLAPASGEEEYHYTNFLQSCIGIMRVSRMVNTLSNENLFFNETYQSIMIHSIMHDDETLRFATIDLVTRNAKSAEVPTDTEFKIVLQFLSINFSHSSNYTRNKLKETMRRFFARIYESSYKIYMAFRRSKHGTDALLEQNEHTSADQTLIPEPLITDKRNYWRLMHFVRTVAILLNRCIYPDAPYEKLLLSIETYALFIDALGEKDCICVFMPQDTQNTELYFNLFNAGLVSTLFNCFPNCWDAIRNAISSLLSKFPSPFEGYTQEHHVNKIMDSAMVLITRPRLREADAGSSMINLLFNKYVRKLGWQLVLIHSAEDEECGPYLHLRKPQKSDSTIATEEEHRCVLSFVNTIQEMLDIKIRECQQSIINICQRSSLVGTLLLYRYILANINIGHLLAGSSSFLPEWQNMATRLIVQLKQICNMTLQIISETQYDEDATEDATQEEILFEGSSGFKVDCRGHLYFDHEDNQLGENADQKLQRIDSSALIVNSWLAVKEACMLIGTLTQSIPLPVNAETNDFDSSRCILSLDQFSDLGAFFLNILLSTKHNGAIEKGHIGLTMLCKTLLNSNIASLYQLPFLWLQKIIEKIEMDEASILRRSAGLPYCLLSIIDAEPDNVPRVLLPYAASKFLEMSRPENAERFSIDTRVNAINLLMVIFKDGVVARYVTPFIEQAFINVLNGFFSPHWTIRNSSMICYAALLKRAIGSVNMLTGSTIQNSITSSEFFSRYPKLRDYLLQQLQEGTDEQHQRRYRLHVGLYPILLLLSRLSPSFKQESSDSISVRPFIELVQKCASLKHYGARSIAARALVPLVPSSSAVEFSSNLLKDLSGRMRSGIISSDAVHGTLLQVFQFFAFSIKETFSPNKRIEAMKDCMELLIDIGTECPRNDCGLATHFLCLRGWSPLSKSIYFDLVHILFEEMRSSEEFWFNDSLVQFMRSTAQLAKHEIFDSRDRVAIGLPRLQDKACRLLCSFEMQRWNAETEVADTAALFVDLVEHESMYVRHASLIVLTDWFISETDGREEKDSWLLHVRRTVLWRLIDGIESDVVSIQLSLKLLVEMYRDSCALFGDLTSRDESKMMSMVGLSKFWKMLLQLREHSNTYISQEAIRLQGLMIKDLMKLPMEQFPPTRVEKLQSIVVDTWVLGLERYSDMDYSEDMRLAVQQSINLSQMLEGTDSVGLGAMFRVCKVCIQLLQDEDEEIRSQTGIMISRQALRFQGEENKSSTNVLQTRIILEKTFAHLTQIMSSDKLMMEEYQQFLLDHLTLPVLSDGTADLPFDQDGFLAEVELFESDEDSSYKEDLLNTHIALHELSHVLDNDDSLAAKFHEDALRQLEQIVNIVVRANGSQLKKHNQLSIFGVPGGLSSWVNSWMAMYKPLVTLAILNKYMGEEEEKNRTRLTDAVNTLIQVHKENEVDMHPLIHQVVQELDGLVNTKAPHPSHHDFCHKFLFLLSQYVRI